MTLFVLYTAHFRMYTSHVIVTVMRIIKLKIFPVRVWLHSGYGKLIFVILSPFFAIFKNVVHSLEPGETPSYLASHQAPNYVQRYQIQQNILKRLRFGCGKFFNLITCMFSTVRDELGAPVCRICIRMQQFSNFVTFIIENEATRTPYKIHN